MPVESDNNVSLARPVISVIIPANDEADYIADCLNALVSSDEPNTGVEVIVVANGCSDGTVEIALSFRAGILTKGWQLTVLDLNEGGKMKALNAGDAQAEGSIRVYLDADVVVGSALLSQLYMALGSANATYASGSIIIQPSFSWFSRAYGRAYARVPFMTSKAPGCGLFAVNAAGRARWEAFPEIISDDTFVRLQFDPTERAQVSAHYNWPIVQGFGNLVKVRQRQDAGVAELRVKYPQLSRNESHDRLTLVGAIRIMLSDPIGFLAYTSVVLSVRLRGRKPNQKWTRGR